MLHGEDKNHSDGIREFTDNMMRINVSISTLGFTVSTLSAAVRFLYKISSKKLEMGRKM